MQAFARVRKQIAVLMRLAAPARHPCGDRSLQARRAIDDEKGRPPQAALDQIRVTARSIRWPLVSCTLGLPLSRRKRKKLVVLDQNLRQTQEQQDIFLLLALLDFETDILRRFIGASLPSPLRLICLPSSDFPVHSA